jgi:hypothetical protein
MDEMHRITLTQEHYHLARQFMVQHRLRSARIAVQKMIEMAADGSREEGEEADARRRERELARR